MIQKKGMRDIEQLEKQELRELKRIEHEMHYGTKELVTGILLGIIIGFLIAIIFF